MADLRTALAEGLANGIAQRYTRDPVVERLIADEVDKQGDQRITDLRTQLAEARQFYDAERQRMLDDGHVPDSHVVKKLEEERDLVIGVLTNRLKRFK